MINKEISTQPDYFGYDFELSLLDTNKDWNISVSGDRRYTLFYGNSGRIFNYNSDYVGGYSLNQAFNLSGVVSPSGYSCFLNESLKFSYEQFNESGILFYDNSGSEHVIHDGIGGVDLYDAGTGWNIENFIYELDSGDISYLKINGRRPNVTYSNIEIENLSSTGYLHYFNNDYPEINFKILSGIFSNNIVENPLVFNIPSGGFLANDSGSMPITSSSTQYLDSGNFDSYSFRLYTTYGIVDISRDLVWSAETVFLIEPTSMPDFSAPNTGESFGTIFYENSQFGYERNDMLSAAMLSISLSSADSGRLGGAFEMTGLSGSSVSLLNFGNVTDQKFKTKSYSEYFNYSGDFVGFDTGASGFLSFEDSLPNLSGLSGISGISGYIAYAKILQSGALGGGNDIFDHFYDSGAASGYSYEIVPSYDESFLILDDEHFYVSHHGGSTTGIQEGIYRYSDTGNEFYLNPSDPSNSGQIVIFETGIGGDVWVVKPSASFGGFVYSGLSVHNGYPNGSTEWSFSGGFAPVSGNSMLYISGRITGEIVENAAYISGSHPTWTEVNGLSPDFYVRSSGEYYIDSGIDLRNYLGNGESGYSVLTSYLNFFGNTGIKVTTANPIGVNINYILDDLGSGALILDYGGTYSGVQENLQALSLSGAYRYLENARVSFPSIQSGVSGLIYFNDLSGYNAYLGTVRSCDDYFWPSPIDSGAQNLEIPFFIPHANSKDVAGVLSSGLQSITNSVQDILDSSNFSVYDYTGEIRVNDYLDFRMVIDTGSTGDYFSNLGFNDSNGNYSIPTNYLELSGRGFISLLSVKYNDDQQFDRIVDVFTSGDSGAQRFVGGINQIYF